MKTPNSQSGFSAIELLITLFVAAAFFVAGYQLYSLIIKDGGQTRAEAKASNTAYNYLRQYSASTPNPCTTSTPVNDQSINVSGLSNVRVTVQISCPYTGTTGTNNATSVSKVQVTINYNNPEKTVRYATFTKS